VFEVNAMGPVTVTNAFLPLLRISRGRVVIVSSVAGMHIEEVMQVTPLIWTGNNSLWVRAHWSAADATDGHSARR
jgi:NAD(P)-dependent dehydrogenase (short-subunit alcohol dehydrogenase family)